MIVNSWQRLLRKRHMLTIIHNRGEAITVARVVVVDVARRVDIPRIVRVVAVRRTQADVVSTYFQLVPFIGALKIIAFLI